MSQSVKASGLMVSAAPERATSVRGLAFSPGRGETIEGLSSSNLTGPQAYTLQQDNFPSNFTEQEDNPAPKNRARGSARFTLPSALVSEIQAMGGFGAAALLPPSIMSHGVAVYEANMRITAGTDNRPGSSLNVAY